MVLAIPRPITKGGQFCYGTGGSYDCVCVHAFTSESVRLLNLKIAGYGIALFFLLDNKLSVSALFLAISVEPV